MHLYMVSRMSFGQNYKQIVRTGKVVLCYSLIESGISNKSEQECLCDIKREVVYIA